MTPRLAASNSTSAVLLAVASHVDRRIASRAAAPIESRRAASSTSRLRASARSRRSPTGVNMPVTPCRISSRLGTMSDATTQAPEAIASKIVRERPSVKDGLTTIADRERRAGTSSACAQKLDTAAHTKLRCLELESAPHRSIADENELPVAPTELRKGFQSVLGSLVADKTPHKGDLVAPSLRPSAETDLCPRHWEQRRPSPVMHPVR